MQLLRQTLRLHHCCLLLLLLLRWLRRLDCCEQK
jgi:hypothetical protein